jgi:hypothetical protein
VAWSADCSCAIHQLSAHLAALSGYWPACRGSVRPGAQRTRSETQALDVARSRVKNGHQHTVPLSDLALSIIDEALAYNANGESVFPDQDGSPLISRRELSSSVTLPPTGQWYRLYGSHRAAPLLGRFSGRPRSCFSRSMSMCCCACNAHGSPVWFDGRRVSRNRSFESDRPGQPLRRRAR